MAFNFSTPTRKFLTEYRNGPLFTDNPTEYSNKVRGNVGDLVRIEETITVDISFNLDEIVTAVWDDTPADGTLTAVGINFAEQGFFVGATVTVFQGEDSADTTIEWIDGGSSFNTLHLDKAPLTFLVNGAWTNIKIRMKSAPSRAQYKYGLIKDDITSIADSNYSSPYDGNVQGFYRITVPSSPTFGSMTQLGLPIKSWNITEEIEISFLGTVDDYFHQFELHHTFRIPYFFDGEDVNLNELIKPDVLNLTNTYKYTSEYRFGNNSELYGTFSQLGITGDVGYFNEQYNGKENIFDIDSLTITNASDTGVLEATETNTVVAVITSTGTSFVADQKVIVGHSRLPSAIEYSNKETPFEDIWLLDTLAQDAGALAVGSVQITNLTVVFDNASQITVTFDIAYTADEQALITNGDRYLMWFTVAEEALGVDLENQVNLRETSFYTKNPNVAGLIINHSPTYSNTLNSYAGARFSTDWQGWDMDFVGCSERFDLIQTDEDNYNVITSIESQIIAVKGDEKFVLFTKGLPFASSELISGGYRYQIVNFEGLDTFRLPSIEALNQNQVQSVPAFPAGFQPFQIQTSVPRIPWQEWISNLDVSTEFYDDAEVNNNQNQRTSNYSDVLGWTVYHQFLIEVENNTRNIIDTPFGPLTAVGVSPTTYELRSDAFNIDPIDFDVTGVWSATVNAFDILGDPTDNIFKDVNTLIRIDFSHNLGLISAQDIGGYISIQKKNSLEPPWQLHTQRDWTNPDNPLTPSDTLLTGNTTLVEVVSSVDLVQFFCFTNKDNLEESVTYTIYGRLEKVNFQ